MSTYVGTTLIAFAVLGLFLGRRLNSQFGRILAHWRIDESMIDSRKFRWQHWKRLRPIYCRLFLPAYLCLVYAFVSFMLGILIVSLPEEKRGGLFFGIAAMTSIGFLATCLLTSIRRRELARLDRIYRLRNLGFTPPAPRLSSDD